jgi:hypothetical protein
VFTVVENQEKMLALQETRQTLRYRHALRGNVPQRGPDRVRHCFGIEHRSEFAEPHTVGEVRQQLRPHLQCEPSLAHAADTDD